MSCRFLELSLQLLQPLNFSLLEQAVEEIREDIAPHVNCLRVGHHVAGAELLEEGLAID
jgi:hypothetical protein